MKPYLFDMFCSRLQLNTITKLMNQITQLTNGKVWFCCF